MQEFAVHVYLKDRYMLTWVGIKARSLADAHSHALSCTLYNYGAGSYRVVDATARVAP